MIYVIIGPTGSGKTEVAHMLANKLNCDLLNADAFQIYKGMDIGTNKISYNDPLRKRYHLLDIITPDMTYSVKQYQDDARKIINEYVAKDINIIIVGGTGLYIKALLYDYSFSDEEITINPKFEDLTNHELYELLKQQDADEANIIHENNRKRLLRALTLIENNKCSKTDIISKQQHDYVYPKELINIIYISPSREILYKAINDRVIKMIDNGLINEVEELMNKYSLSITAQQGIGYKEVIDYLNGSYDKEECVALIQKRTRNYAKRQETFFKHQFKNYKIFSSIEESIKFVNENIIK